MAQVKSHSGASKRFQKTASDKLRVRHAYSSHILEKKSPKRKRGFRKDRVIAKSDQRTVRKLLEGSGSWPASSVPSTRARSAARPSSGPRGSAGRRTPTTGAPRKR